MECYFVSDVHLGSGDNGDASKTETFVNFLRSLQGKADVLYLLGDIFDFWLEYEDEIPAGYEAVLSEIRTLTGNGCRVKFLRGNHDYWTLDYFERELGMEVFSEPYLIEKINGLDICVGHGDVVGCSTLKDRITFFLFRNRFLIHVLRSMPRRWISAFAHRWSARSRKSGYGYVFDPESSELRRFCERLGRTTRVDHFIFGHFHRRISIPIEGGAFLHILGEWSDGGNYLNLSGTNISGLGFPNTVR